MKIDSMESLFLHELSDLYNAEKQIIKALPKMEEAATSPDLKAAFEEHLEVTKEQLGRLEQIFETLEHKVSTKKCKAMEGIIKEANELLSEDVDPPILDAALIGAAQKVEHYEIAGYGTARAYARLLGHEDAARLLEQTLEEEGETDKKLTALAESHLNQKAAQESRG
jgi:ferritin-like metal-binding protein YciE